jgi:hypothetical protein
MMTKTFILTNVVPNMRKRLSESCCYILGKALLWYIFYPNNTVPQEFANRIKFELKEIYLASGVDGVDDPDFNPVTKVPVIISGDEGTVFIEVVEESLQGANLPELVVLVVAVLQELEFVNNYWQCNPEFLNSVRDVEDIKSNQGVDRSTLMKKIDLVNANVKRIGNQPAQMMVAAATRRDENLNLLAGVVVRAGGGGMLHEPPIASLSPMPRNLFELWREYQHGIGGRKPACEFSRVEKGRVKHKYHRRNVVWLIIENLVRLGFTAETAIDRIHAIYGSQTSVTEIINQLKTHKKAGTLSPNLRPIAR